ncbi:MAG TPA: ribonuclease III [Caulobacteraceae bacterium]|jgi:ribonuclease-3|nr:ribonuclease III [Caulobacteraceae bacterium]
MNARAAAVSGLAARLGHDFAAPALLERALTHASVGDGAVRPGKGPARDNERLEFLGDRVLGLLTAELLLERFPEAAEGEMAPRLNLLVSREACARVARRLELGPALRLAGGESKGGGRDKSSILAGACEALIAALYLDGGLAAARVFFERWWAEELGALPPLGQALEVKLALQQWAQKAGKPIPAYTVIGREGPDHAPQFTVEVQVQGVAPAVGAGPSRQAAEKSAAQALWDREAPTL